MVARSRADSVLAAVVWDAALPDAVHWDLERGELPLRLPVVGGLLCPDAALEGLAPEVSGSEHELAGLPVEPRCSGNRTGVSGLAPHPRRRERIRLEQPPLRDRRVDLRHERLQVFTSGVGA